MKEFFSFFFVVFLTTVSLADPRFPTEKEQALIGDDVVIVKLKLSETNIQPFYHKWLKIWDDKMFFRVKGSNKEVLHRAMMLSYPMYILDDDQQVEYTHRGYVVGINLKQAVGTQVFPLKEVIWLESKP